jgi:small subunit ribosomal protein S17
MTPATASKPVQARGQRKLRVGLVVSNRMKKTIVVRVTQLVRHPKYNRVMPQTSSFKAHDEANTAAIGDWVKIMETRPLSKDKRWRLVEVLKRASTAPPVPGEESEAAARPRKAAQAAAEGSAPG